MKIPCLLFREILERIGDKAVRKSEMIEVTLEYDGDGNILTSSHPDKTFGQWIIVPK